MLNEDDFMHACVTKGIVIDTNIFAAFLVGLKNPKDIPVHRKTNRYFESDFSIILKLIEKSAKIIISPYVLAESSNLPPIDGKWKKDGGFIESPYFSGIIKFLFNEKLIEKTTTFNDLIKKPEFRKFGATDTAIVDLASVGYAILSDDKYLREHLRHNNRQVLSMSELRAKGLSC